MWSLNEITDNVINHAQSPIGGLLQITNFGREQKLVEFCVCDAGIGIPASLRGGHKEIRSDQELCADTCHAVPHWTGLVVFPLAREAQGFGSRAAGMPLRQKLKNLVRICGGKRIGIDFSDVPIISSSFADEVFGKLFAELGPLGFMKAFEFRKVDSTIHGLINRAIEQRAKKSPKPIVAI